MGWFKSTGKLIENKVKNVKFNSHNGDIYDHGVEYEIKLTKEKLEKAKKDYDKAKKEYDNLIKLHSKEKGGLSKFV